MRHRLGLLVIALSLGCFEEDPITTTTVGEASGPPTTSSGTTTTADASTGGSGSSGADSTGGVTTNTTNTTGPGDTGSTGQLPVMCEDGLVAPEELCLGDLTVLMANAPIVAARIGDVSGSDDADVVYLIPDQIVVRVGDGGGNFGPSVFDEAVTGVDFELVDMNADDELDVVAVEDSGPLRVLLGNGGGAFTSADLDPVGGDPISVAVGPLDGDDYLDVLVGGGIDGMLHTALGVGDGTVLPPTSVVAFGSVQDIALADFTGEGNLDVAIAIQGGGIQGVALRPGDGSGGLQDQRTTPGTMPGARALVTGDFNGDDLPDLAYVSQTQDQLGVLLNTGGAFEPEQTYPVGSEPVALVAADLDGDGRHDLAVGHDGESVVRVMIPEPDGSMVEAEQFMLAAPVDDLAVGDVNGDGAPDIAATSGAATIITLLISTP